MSEPTKKILIGVFSEGLPTHLYFPPGSLKSAEKILDAERAKREALAGKPRLEAQRAAKARGKLTKAIAQVFRRRGR